MRCVVTSHRSIIQITNILESQNGSLFYFREVKYMKKFDKEYSTQFTPEMKYLQSVGINYVFVKDINDVTTYKYEKSPELFKHLEIFYLELKKQK